MRIKTILITVLLIAISTSAINVAEIENPATDNLDAVLLAQNKQLVADAISNLQLLRDKAVIQQYELSETIKNIDNRLNSLIVLQETMMQTEKQIRANAEKGETDPVP